MRSYRSAAIAAAMTLALASTATAGWCKPKQPEPPTASITICQDPRAIFALDGEGTVTLRFVSAKTGKVVRKEIQVDGPRTAKRWVLGRTKVWVEADGQRITPKVAVNRRTNVGRCPR